MVRMKVYKLNQWQKVSWREIVIINKSLRVIIRLGIEIHDFDRNFETYVRRILFLFFSFLKKIKILSNFINY